jgi:hypothetical protein
VTEAAKIITIESPQQMAVPQPTDGGMLIHMIDRAARDPSVDMAKLKELMDMRRTILAEQAEDAFNTAMAKAQSEMLPVVKNANNSQTKSKYASFDALDHAIRPIYTKNGFGLSFNTGDGAPPDHVRVLAYVTHTGTGRSHTRTYHIDMPADGKGAKGGDVMTKTHATGSAFKYGRRYLLEAIFNIATKDDDGNAAGGGVISEAQLDNLRTKVTDYSAVPAKIAAFAKVERLEDIPAKDFKRVVDALEAWARQQKAGK